MKKLTTILAGIILFISANAFTPITDVNVSNTIKSYFARDFEKVSEVKWQKVEDLYVATFQSDDSYLTAAYNEAGELLVVAKYIDSSILPDKVTKSLLNKYAGYTIDRSVIELTSDTKDYVITAENKKFKLSLKSDENGSFTVMSKTKK